jgi:hypothetical protein
MVKVIGSAVRCCQAGEDRSEVSGNSETRRGSLADSLVWCNKMNQVCLLSILSLMISLLTPPPSAAQDAPAPGEDPACTAWLSALNALLTSPLPTQHLPPLPPASGCAQTWASADGQQALLRCAARPPCEAALRAALTATQGASAQRSGQAIDQLEQAPQAAPSSPQGTAPDTQAQLFCDGFAQIVTAQAGRCAVMGGQLDAWVTATARGEGSCARQWRAYQVSSALIACLHQPQVQRALDALLRLP